MGRKAFTLKDLHDLAKGRRGILHFSDYSLYINGFRKLLWECEKGHKWEVAPVYVKQGKWCRACHVDSLRNGLEKYTKICLERGSVLHTKQYVTSEGKLHITCEHNHEFTTNGHTIDKGSWCPECALVKKKTLHDCKMEAEKYGGKCLSLSVGKHTEKMKWECAAGHRFLKGYGRVFEKYWCQKCSIGIGERTTRQVFESIFNKEFPTRHPKWLKLNGERKPRELDGYNEELKIAFEHQGQQHYDPVPRFNKGKHDLEGIQKVDKLKIKLCKKNNVELVVVSYRDSILDIKTKIHDLFQDTHKLPPDLFDRNIELKTTVSRDLDFYNRLKIGAERVGLVTISQHWMGSHAKHKFKCKNNPLHSVTKTPNAIQKGQGCKYCKLRKNGSPVKIHHSEKSAQVKLTKNY